MARSSPTELALNIGVSILTFVCLLLGTEFLLRVTVQPVGPRSPGIYRVSANAQRHYELLPSVQKNAFRSTITINDDGLRGPPVDRGKPVLPVLGDSIVFGHGVEDDETLPARLQALLPAYVVLNAGTPGYNLPQQAALYRETLAPLQPSLLVQVLYFNDFTDPEAFLDRDGILRPEGWTPENDTCDPLGGILRLLPAQCWFNRHSALYIVMKKIITRRTNTAALERERSLSAEHPLNDGISPAQEERYFSQLRSFARSLGALPRILVLWPDQEMHVALRLRIRTVAEGLGYRVLDLYDVFQNRVPVLGWDTVHPTADALAFAAKHVAAFLRESRIP